MNKPTYNAVYYKVWRKKHRKSLAAKALKRYHENTAYRENTIARRKKRRLRNLKITYSYKNRPCMDCQGWFNPWQMQFDHRPGTTKVNDVGMMVSYAVKVPKLLEEIAKCDVVCANCHWDRTYKRLQEKSL